MWKKIFCTFFITRKRRKWWNFHGNIVGYPKWEMLKKKRRWHCWLRIMITFHTDSRRQDTTSTAFGNWMNSQVTCIFTMVEFHSWLSWGRDVSKPGAPSSSRTELCPFSSVKTLCYLIAKVICLLQECPCPGKSRVLYLEIAPLPLVAICGSMFTPL